MFAYTIKRILWFPVVLAIISFVTFTMGFYGPGDPAMVRLGSKATPEAVERMREKMGLNEPFMYQYMTYASSALKGNFGESHSFSGRSVSELIVKKIGISLQLGLGAMFISLSIGIPLGIFAAIKQGTAMDTFLVGFSLFFYATPVFISAPVLILLFGVKFHLLPTSGWDGIVSLSAIMPIVILGFPGIAVMTRLTRASFLEVINQDFVRTAYAKGLSEYQVNFRHVLKNALIPLITIIGLSLATLVEGAFIAETIFGIPGIGRFAVESILSRDYPVIMAVTIITAFAFSLTNLIVDLLYCYVDPRIRLIK